METELETILAWFATDLADDQVLDIGILAAGDLNRTSCWTHAAQHGLLPALYLLVAECAPESIPASIASDFRARSSKSLAYARELLRLIDHLESDGITSVSLKGPLLAESAFGNVLARAFDDLDLVVRGSERDAAIESLIRFGYRPKIERSPSAETRHRKRCFDYDLVDPSGTIALELHDGLGAAGWPRTPVEDLFDRRARGRLLCREVWTFSPEDLVWYLSMHGASHQWCRLEWLVSLAYQIRRGPRVDWSKVVDRATDAGVLRAALIGFHLCESQLGVSCDASVLDAIDRDPRVTLLANRAIQNLGASEARSISNISFNVAIRESVSTRLRYLCSIGGKVARRHGLGGQVAHDNASLRRTLRRGAALIGTLWPGRAPRA